MTRENEDELPVIRAADVTGELRGPEWLVTSLWARAGVGILGGAPKCCKSWLALEMALAVGSGAPCLGSFQVGDAGGVLLYMAEDAAPVVKARLSGICQHRGLDLAQLPVHLITAPALRLDRERDQARLRDSVAKYAPRLLILDPFVRLHRIDENDAGQVSALLGYLRELSRAHDLAVLVVHHARKNGTSGQPGNSLRGSGDFFAWADSLLYVRRHKGQLLLTIEHRGAPAPDPLGLTLRADEDVHLELIDPTEAPNDDPLRDGALDRAVLAALAPAPLARADLRAKLRVRNERLGDALIRLAQAAVALQRFWTMLAHYHGQIWKTSEPARALGVGESTTRRYLDLLTNAFMVRQLQPWHANLSKRQVKAPKVYVRDSGLLHQLLGIRTAKELLSHPKVGASWEGFVLEQVLAIEPHDEAYFWATYQGAEMDLVLRRQGRSWGVEFKRADAPKLTPSIRVALADLELERVAIVYPGSKRFPLADAVEAVPLESLARGENLFPESAYSAPE